MTDQAIIALVLGCCGAITALMYFLISGIKTLLDDQNKEQSKTLSKIREEQTSLFNKMLTKIDEFDDSLEEVKISVASKGTTLEFLQREIESIKRQCWDCNQGSSSKDKGRSKN